MSSPRKTAIVTGASQGIGAGIVKGFVERGFNVIANSRKVTQSAQVAASDYVALVDGHIESESGSVLTFDTKSLVENSTGSCFRGKDRMARHDDRNIPSGGL